MEQDLKQEYHCFSGRNLYAKNPLNVELIVSYKCQMRYTERESTIIIDVLEWINAPRHGTKNGKQNTQLELKKNML